MYRDQGFTADVGLHTVMRIEAVKILREKQFREDASESRHPVRPESAHSSREHTIDALASSTTYHKGAEVSYHEKASIGPGQTLTQSFDRRYVACTSPFWAKRGFEKV